VDIAVIKLFFAVLMKRDDGLRFHEETCQKIEDDNRPKSTDKKENDHNDSSPEN
jgi:hypothetical protein